jgi:hypothetical protein
MPPKGGVAKAPKPAKPVKAAKTIQLGLLSEPQRSPKVVAAAPAPKITLKIKNPTGVPDRSVGQWTAFWLRFTEEQAAHFPRRAHPEHVAIAKEMADLRYQLCRPVSQSERWLIQCRLKELERSEDNWQRCYPLPPATASS